MAATVNFDVKTEEWTFNGKRREVNRHTETLIVHISDLETCTATDLKNALLKAEKVSLGVEYVEITEVAEQFVREDWLPLSDVRFVFHKDKLDVSFSFVGEADEDSTTPHNDFAGILRPLLLKYGATLEMIEAAESHTVIYWELSLSVKSHGKKLSYLFQAAVDCKSLLEAYSTGDLTRESVAELVRAGRADVLIGQPEGHWLEAKSQHYELGTASGDISLARTVSRFCNSEDGGIVVVGLQTKKTAEGDELISRVRPMPAAATTYNRYKKVLENRLFPPPDDLHIEVVSHEDDTELVFINIPPQPEELKPFLVSGEIINGKEERTFISIVRRRGDTSMPITAPMIHSTLAAGRALLRRGVLPTDD